MNLEHIIAFNLALLVALISPGPAFVISIQTTLSSGRNSGAWFGVGLGLMAALWTGLALLGLEAVFHIFPWAYGTVRTLGAAYLIYIAVKMWRGSSQELAQNSIRNQGYSFFRGVMVNALNPKSIIFAAALLAVIFPQDMSLTENMFVVLNQFVVEVFFYVLLAYVISRDSVRSSYIKIKKYLDRLSSVVLGGLGLSLLADRYASS